MQRAIKLCTDRRTLAELYGELAFETSNRAGMWRRRPDRDLVDGWIAQALELADPGSEARLRALLALSYWNPEGAADAPREAVEIAERLGDPELRSYAYDARAISLFVHGRIELGHELEKRRFELLDRIIDPEHVADIHYAPITASVWHGDFAEARYLARRHDEISAPLTAHHRIHGVAVLLEVEELAGCWETILTLQHVAEVRVAANADTPCVRNARSLLVCALANVYVGRAEEAKRLERAAEEMRMEGFGHVLDTPRVRLGLARGDLERVERLLAEPPPPSAAGTAAGCSSRRTLHDWTALPRSGGATSSRRGRASTREATSSRSCCARSRSSARTATCSSGRSRPSKRSGSVGTPPRPARSSDHRYAIVIGPLDDGAAHDRKGEGYGTSDRRRGAGFRGAYD